MIIHPFLVPFANDVARWGAAKGPAAMMRAGLAEVGALEAPRQR